MGGVREAEVRNEPLLLERSSDVWLDSNQTSPTKWGRRFDLNQATQNDNTSYFQHTFDAGLTSHQRCDVRSSARARVRGSDRGKIEIGDLAEQNGLSGRLAGDLKRLEMNGLIEDLMG